MIGAMKNCTMLLLVFLWVLPAFGQDATVITPEQAAQHVGETVTVEGVVTKITESRKGNIFLNFGGNYPKEIFNVFVPASSGLLRAEFGALEGQKVRVTGKVGKYQGKPEIIVTRRDQVKP